MKKVLATLLISVFFGFIIILGYAIALNATGITEAFFGFPLPYLFWFILGILVGGVFAPFIYKRIKLFAEARKALRNEVNLE